MGGLLRHVGARSDGLHIHQGHLQTLHARNAVIVSLGRQQLWKAGNHVLYAIPACLARMEHLPQGGGHVRNGDVVCLERADQWDDFAGLPARCQAGLLYGGKHGECFVTGKPATAKQVVQSVRSLFPRTALSLRNRNGRIDTFLAPLSAFRILTGVCGVRHRRNLLVKRHRVRQRTFGYCNTCHKSAADSRQSLAPFAGGFQLAHFALQQLDLALGRFSGAGKFSARNPARLFETPVRDRGLHNLALQRLFRADAQRRPGRVHTLSIAQYLGRGIAG
ncbi:hypothetical protein D3C87_1386670 [compost metagenome]